MKAVYGGALGCCHMSGGLSGQVMTWGPGPSTRSSATRALGPEVNRRRLCEVLSCLRGLPISGSLCKELGSCHFILTVDWGSITLLCSMREQRAQGKPLFPGLEMLTGELTASQREVGSRHLPCKPVLGDSTFSTEATERMAVPVIMIGNTARNQVLCSRAEFLPLSELHHLNY